MLASRGIIVQSLSSRGVAEEAPGAYKDVAAVVDAADRAGVSTQDCQARAAPVHQAIGGYEVCHRHSRRREERRPNYSAGQVGNPRTSRDYMQRLIEQPVGQGEVFAESGSVGQFHYHLAVYQHFSNEDGEPVPAHVEVEGLVTAVDAIDDPTIVDGLHRLGLELTLRLADGRALDFRIVDAQGAIHSTGRGLRP
jgi:hypothetical protein